MRDDITETGIIFFCNELDKGNICLEVAYQNGKQLTLQPDFAKSDRHFKRKETLASAAILTDRACKEKVARLSKQSGYISRGESQSGSLLCMDNACMAWSFQCNFMFENVL